MVTPLQKQLLVGAATLAFAGQSWLVYDDEPSAVQLEGAELEGAETWHAAQCQACHQLYGYGGFLGPDLTNAARLHGPDGLRQRLDELLVHGSGQMPAFPELGPDDREDLAAFLEAMDRSGLGEARVAGTDLAELLGTQTGELARGQELFLGGSCRGCHVLFSERAGGAPDLSRAADRLSPAELDAVLRDGRLPGMPPTGLSDADRSAAGDLAARRLPSSPGRVPASLPLPRRVILGDICTGQRSWRRPHEVKP